MATGQCKVVIFTQPTPAHPLVATPQGAAGCHWQPPMEWTEWRPKGAWKWRPKGVRTDPVDVRSLVRGNVGRRQCRRPVEDPARKLH